MTRFEFLLPKLSLLSYITVLNNCNELTLTKVAVHNRKRGKTRSSETECMKTEWRR